MRTAIASIVVVVLAGAALLFLSSQEKVHGVDIWGIGDSFTRASGYEFNNFGAGHDGIPEIIVFCKVQEGNKHLPTFAYQVGSSDAYSYWVTINKQPLDVDENDFAFYVNDAEGKPRRLNLDREVGAKVLDMDHEGYIKFWNEVVEPQLKK